MNYEYFVSYVNLTHTEVSFFNCLCRRILPDNNRLVSFHEYQAINRERRAWGKPLSPCKDRPRPIDPSRRVQREKVSPSLGSSCGEPREFPFPSPPRSNVVYSRLAVDPLISFENEKLIPDKIHSWSNVH